MNRLIVFGIVMVLLAESCKNEIIENPQVLTDKGLVEGFIDSTTGLQQFYGIPYAKPPVGDLRWKAPQELDNWEGIKETKKFAARAIQRNEWGDMIYRSDTLSEDCLYLNVWSPNISAKEKLPVLVYFHGGGLVAGTGNEPRYDGAAMAQQGIVVVNVNYRLNIFGLFAHPELSAESPYKASGNYSLLDQVAALIWVNKNIEFFGGNPNEVTIAGESAGSISVSMHLVSPLSKGLFARAIGQSGAAIHPTRSIKTLEEAEKEGIKFMKKHKFSSLEELKDLSGEELFNYYIKSKRYGFPTVLDGYFLEDSLVKAFNDKKQAQVPLLMGWTSAEMPGAILMEGTAFTKENFELKVKKAFPDVADELLNISNHESEEEINYAATQLASDRFISYAAWKWFSLHKNNSDQPIYRYYFDQIKPNNYGLIGAPHASDIEYLLGNLQHIKDVKWTEEDYLASEIAQEYLANFIKTGNPNSEALPLWENANVTGNLIPVMNLKADAKQEIVEDNRYFILDKYYVGDKK